MFEAFKKLKLASAFLGHSHEGRPGQSFSLRDVLGDLSERELESFGGEIDELMSQPGVGQLYENRYLPPPESLDVLLDLPRDTLGYNFGLYLKRHRLKIGPPPADFDFADRLAYIRERVRMTHALLHVVTNYDASTLGELAVQAYIVGQTNNLVSGTIIAAGLITMIREEPARLGEALQVMAEANERGRQARSFLGVPWEEFWTAPLDDIRDIAGIPPRTSESARLDLDRLAVEAAAMSVAAAVEPPARPPDSATRPTLRFSEPEPQRTTLRFNAPEPEPQRTTLRFDAPEPEPEPEPQRPTLRFNAPEPRKPQRWAGLDLLSQVASEPEPAPTPPTPEPTPTPPPAAAPTRANTPAPTLTAPVVAPKPTRPPLADSFENDIFAPPLPPLEVPRSEPEPPRPAEPARPITRSEPPRPAEAAPKVIEPPRAPPAFKPPPHKAPPGTEPSYVEIEDVAEDLPKPGDPDYF